MNAEFQFELNGVACIAVGSSQKDNLIDALYCSEDFQNRAADGLPHDRDDKSSFIDTKKASIAKFLQLMQNEKTKLYSESKQDEVFQQVENLVKGIKNTI